MMYATRDVGQWSAMSIVPRQWPAITAKVLEIPERDIDLIALHTMEELYDGSSVRRSIKMKPDKPWFDKPSTVDAYIERINSLILHMRGDKNYWSYTTPEHHYRWK